MEKTLKDGRVLTIRRAMREDAAQMVAYIAQVAGESEFLLRGEGEPLMSVEQEEKFIDSYSDPFILLCGWIGGELASVASLSVGGKPRIAHTATLGISVAKKYWALGVGTHMMQALIDHARGVGTIEILHLGVRADNVHARRLYERAGFEQIGRYPGYFKVRGEYYDEILMNLYLNKEILKKA